MSADAGGVRLWSDGEDWIELPHGGLSVHYIAYPAAQAEAMEAVVRDAVELCRQQLAHRLLDLPDSVRRYLATLAAPASAAGEREAAMKAVAAVLESAWPVGLAWRKVLPEIVDAALAHRAGRPA